MTVLSELRSSVRLRIGLALIVAIFVGYALLEWSDGREARLAEYRQLSVQLARVGNQQDQALWQARASEAQAASLLAEQGLWQGESMGLAQARLQDWLYALLRQADAKGFIVKITESEAVFEKAKLDQGSQTLLPDLQLLRARLEFNTDPQLLLALLAALNDSAQQIGVDTLSVKPAKTALDLAVWVRIRPAAEKTSAEEAPK